ncbi:BNR-4 repeat-containing protein [Catelliglobosispora koreensis]|uniref:BNR-4 repeat-containing protein n=1 Tax=Catelliglobosispora koreensis TaxID=129052 RepID=UPI00035C8B94|nr:BNR-4 repeat-containing protein [Catelliglobosispora koreensis]
MRRLLAAVLLAPLVVATPASAAATLTLVPYGIDSSNQAGWWAPLETYVGGSQYAYLAFNEPAATAGNHKVAIARRDGSGNWTKLPVMNGAVQAEYVDDIGHNQPSIARDGSGRFHVFASMHNNVWRYFRSDVTGGAPQWHSGDMPDQGIGVTYPVLATAPNGDVYLLARLDGSGSRTGRLYRWNNAASTWSRIAIIGNSPSRAFYPDDLQFDSAGNLHLLWEWSVYPSSGFRHELSYLRYTPATGAFSDHNGAAVTVPVTTATADIVQPMTAGEVYGTSDAIAVQSAKLTLDGTSPKVAYRYRTGATFAVYYAWISGGAWSREIAYTGSETSAAIDITWHPVDGKRIYYALTAGTDRAFMATKPAASWVQTSVAPGVPVSRLSVERNSAGSDVLYLVDLVNLRLYYGTN